MKKIFLFALMSISIFGVEFDKTYPDMNLDTYRKIREIEDAGYDVVSITYLNKNTVTHNVTARFRTSENKAIGEKSKGIIADIDKEKLLMELGNLIIKHSSDVDKLLKNNKE